MKKALLSTLTLLFFSKLFAARVYTIQGEGIFSFPIVPSSSQETIGEPKPAIGGGIGFEFRPTKSWGITGGIDYGKYSNKLAGVSDVSITNYSVDIKKYFPLNDYFTISPMAQVGLYSASRLGNYKGISTGVGIETDYKLSSIYSIYAKTGCTYFYHKDFPMMKAGCSLGFRLNLTNLFDRKGNMSVDVVETTPIFPALYSWYNKNPFGSIKVYNQEDGTITNVRISLYQEEFMNTPKVYETIPMIKKNDFIDLNLTAFFNENVLNLIEPVEKNAVINIKYDFLREERETNIPLSIYFLNRNNLSWDDDRMAAVFVCPNDSEALSFAKQVKSVVRDHLDREENINIQYALALFESLHVYGLNYVVDPSSSYSANIGTSSIDFLQFPYQTLNYRGGDCDDLSILYCSLLESLGIEGAFITVPGHIYTGICLEETEDPRAQEEHPVLYKDKIYYEGKIWQPLEITMLKDGFVRAIRFGVEEWKKYIDEARIFPIHSNWELYSSISSPEKKHEIMLDHKEDLLKAFLRQQYLLTGKKQKQYKDL
ncbi:hypothetical protein [Treponema sp.]|uniref:hypothetical protein n=1 Tax=Treponema sp. TaxID=166 RepID=UPI00388DBE4B